MKKQTRENEWKKYEENKGRKDMKEKFKKI
jgi:hypothetical protein